LNVLASGAHVHKNMSMMLHVTAPFKGKMMFKHVTATAKLRYTAHDVFVTVTTDNLPKPAQLGERAYAVFATDGAMADRVGFLHMSGNMASVKGQVMMTKVQDIYVWAVGSMTEKHQMGKKVLGAMVM